MLMGLVRLATTVCGDMMTFYTKVKDNRIEDVKYKKAKSIQYVWSKIMNALHSHNSNLCCLTF